MINEEVVKMKLNGIGVYEGIVFGSAYIYAPFDPYTIQYNTDELCNAEDRHAAYALAMDTALSELKSIYEKLMQEDPDKAKIFFAQQILLSDVSISEEIHTRISGGQSVSAAILDAFEEFIKLLGRSDDELTRERAADLKDVRNRLLRCLEGKKECNISQIDKPVIVFAHELFPSDTATINRENVLAIVTENGGATSHTAIVAKSYRIPTILGVKDVLQFVRGGTEAIVDSLSGVVLLDPGNEETEIYKAKQRDFIATANIIKKYHSLHPLTKDNTKVDIMLNISGVDKLLPEDIDAADGVGLLRSEFLYMESGEHLPDEEQQFLSYKAAVEAFKGKPVVLRTLDIGGDKQLPSLNLPKEENPFLGNRAVRLCFDNKDLFATQIRAALRASYYGNLWIMFPMVGSLDDIRRAKSFVQNTMNELDLSEIPYDKNIMLGIMIEIPAIALMSDKVVNEVDFASIGTNDLCQYLMAADRHNPAVAEYYQELNPVVFRLIRTVANIFVKAQKPLSVCGEMGGDPQSALVLIGLGLRELSMGASSMAGVKRLISNITITEAEEIAQMICNMGTESEVKAELYTKIKYITEH